MKKLTLLIVFCILLPLITILWSFTPISETDHPVITSITEKFRNYFTRLPQQKVYLHFDKSSYKADETVWLKAYLVKAANHIPDSSTTNLYIHLINPSGYIVQSKLIRLTNGFGNGDFSFQDTIPEGKYKVRAFTNWMLNFNKDFLFEREIYIENPNYASYVTKDELNTIKKENRKNQKIQKHYDIQFLPEGGHLLSGIENRLGFKALNELGHGTFVSGEIVDSKGKNVASFSSSALGIGSVNFTPAPKEKYTAFVKTDEGKPVHLKVPDTVTPGVNIAVTRIENGIARIRFLTNFPPGQFPPNTKYFLLGHIRGGIIFTHEFDMQNQQNTFDLSTNELPSGIMHLTLFNSYSQPVSERLIYITNHADLSIKLEAEKAIATVRSNMSVNIKITDSQLKPAIGNFSLSIANTENDESEDNICTYLLLNSDLKGKIENPEFYFTNFGQDKIKQLDDLLLTQGWRRFSWTNVLSGNRFSPEYENEKGITISGRITKEFFGIPLRDIKVTLNILNEFNDVFTTRSGDRGIFRFDNLDYQDTVSVSIEALRASGRPNLLIYVDENSDERDKEMKYQTRQGLKQHGKLNQNFEPENPDANDPYAEKNKRMYRIHEEPSASNVIIIDEKTQSYQNVGQILQGRIPGVMVSGNKVNIRGVNTFYGSTDPLFLVDGMPVDPDYAMSMNPFDIERIEVLKGSEAAIYGSRGSNGVIAIYTKRGKFMKKGSIDFKMLGYATPGEYYNPKFEYRSDDPFEDGRRTILWVPYITTDSNGDAKVRFYTSDVKGKYSIRLEGISNDGKPAVAVSEFEVR